MSIAMYKVWDGRRTTKKMVVAKSLEGLLSKGRDKLDLLDSPTELRLVMEKDGSHIDDDDCLEFITKDDVLMILAPGQEWMASSPATVVNVYTDHNGSLTTETDLSQSGERSLPATPTTTAGPPPPATTPTRQPPNPTPVPLPSTSAWQASTPPAGNTAPYRLPVFSDYVKARLQAGDSHLVWVKSVAEAAYFYVLNYPQMGTNNSSGDYRVVGQAMYKAFPCIARDGTQPWSVYAKALSQKIRHVRWDNKRKSCPSSSSGPARPTKSPKRFRLQPIDDPETDPTEDYESHVKELAAEMSKKEPSATHTKTLLKSIFRQRRTWISGIPNGNVATILQQFPCFKVKTFAGDALDTLSYIETECSYKHGKGQKSKSVVQICVLGETDPIEKLLQSSANTPPKLIGLKKEGELVNFAIVADSTSILMDTTIIEEAILLLLGFYYVVDLEYPRIYSQVLGFFQHVALQQPFEVHKTHGFSQIVKKININ